MTREYWVTFTAEETDPGEQVGFELATRIRDGLRSEGVSAGEVERWRDNGWSVDCRIDGANVYFFVAFFGRGPQQWALCCTSDRGLVSRLLGARDDDQRRALALAVARVLGRDPGVGDVRWYDAWRGRDDDAWTNEPG